MVGGMSRRLKALVEVKAMAATEGAGKKAGITSAAQGAGWDLHQFLSRYDRNGYFDAFVAEGLMTERDRQTLYKLRNRLTDRGVPLRYRD
jgi:hypothetical protein